MPPAKPRSYDESEVRAILDRALRGSEGAPSGTALSHEQLLEIGAEIGLSAQQIERAAEDVAQAKSVAAMEERIILRRRRWFGHHLSLFLGINGILFLINFLTTPGQWWFLFAFVAMLLPLAVHARLGLSKHISARALRREAERTRERLLHAGAPGASRFRVALEDEAVAPSSLENAELADPQPHSSRRSGA